MTTTLSDQIEALRELNDSQRIKSMAAFEAVARLVMAFPSAMSAIDELTERLEIARAALELVPELLFKPNDPELAAELDRAVEKALLATELSKPAETS